MGDACQKPKNHVAVDRALNQANGSDPFTEAERLKNFDGEQRAHYERIMANAFGIGRGEKKASALDALPKMTENSSKPKMFGKGNERYWSRPSEIFSKKFYGAIDKKFEVWQKKGGHPTSYQEMVGRPAKTLLSAIEKVLKDSVTNKALLNRDLKKLGLDADTVYDARRYLDWVAKGGHTRKGEYLEDLTKLGGNIAKAQANFQMLWTLGNGADMVRVYSHYLTRKGASVMDVLQGTMDAMRATKNNPFKRIPELEQKGVYSSEHLDRGGQNVNPFEWSVTAQKNLTYYLDKAAGGDGMTGIRDQLFDSKPWDRGFYDRNHDLGLVWGLARYPINESRWLLKTAKAAYQGDKREVANLLVYSMARAFFFGGASNIPAPIYRGLSKDDKEAIKLNDEKMKLNLAKIASRKLLGMIGVDAEINMGEYVQPFGGTIGARAESIKTTADTVAASGTKTVRTLAKGNLPAAAAHAAATTSALANLTNYEKAVKLLGGVNSATVTKLFSTLGKEMEGEFKREGAAKRQVVKDIFGARTVKKAENE